MQGGVTGQDRCRRVRIENPSTTPEWLGYEEQKERCQPTGKPSQSTHRVPYIHMSTVHGSTSTHRAFTRSAQGLRVKVTFCAPEEAAARLLCVNTPRGDLSQVNTNTQPWAALKKTKI